MKNKTKCHLYVFHKGLKNQHNSKRLIQICSKENLMACIQVNDITPIRKYKPDHFIYT